MICQISVREGKRPFLWLADWKTHQPNGFERKKTNSTKPEVSRRVASSCFTRWYEVVVQKGALPVYVCIHRSEAFVRILQISYSLFSCFCVPWRWSVLVLVFAKIDHTTLPSSVIIYKRRWVGMAMSRDRPITVYRGNFPSKTTSIRTQESRLREISYRILVEALWLACHTSKRDLGKWSNNGCEVVVVMLGLGGYGFGNNVGVAAFSARTAVDINLFHIRIF